MVIKGKRLSLNPFWNGTTFQLWLCMFLVFMWFDVEWCMDSTFTAFIILETWVNTMLLTFLLTMPQMLWGLRRTQSVLVLLAAVWCECNLMYYRTYFTAIPLGSYLMAGNLTDFTASVVDSMRWADLVFLIPVIWAFVVAFRSGGHPAGSSRKAYLLWTCILVIISGLLLLPHGGLTKAWTDMTMAAYRHSCRVPMYTLAGSLLNDALTTYTPITGSQRQEVEQWMDFQEALSAPDDSLRRESLVVILLESFESWPVGLRVQGKEITPNINSLVSDSTTLYVPHVVSQVGTGRSIDAQLLINAGMLPMYSGIYSTTKFDNIYHTLSKRMKAERGARSYILTGDKPSTWNQAAVAEAFGIDTVLSRKSWVAEEKMGGRHQIGDRALMRQIIAKCSSRGGIWPIGEPIFIQIVTYSGHNPFRLPEQYDELKLDYTELPETVANYLTTLHYTDQAVGLLIDYLKTRPDYSNTLIVITGDHEGLASERRDLASECNFISPKQEVPLIVVNSPMAGRIDKVMGQVDIHPTLLQLMGLGVNGWRGMGQSILSPFHPGVAIGSREDVQGDTTGVDTATLTHLRRARKVSDLIINHDLLK